MTQTMAELIAMRFIQRKDVKAKQSSNGAYFPVTEYDPVERKFTDVRLPFKMADLEAHLAGTQTYGHYLIDQADQCKLFAFDIDLEPNRADFVGQWCQLPDWSTLPDDCDEVTYMENVQVHQFDARESWHDRAHPSRDWTKLQLRTLSESLSRAIKEELDLPVAVAYSGSKGLHVYGFTGTVPAHEAREAAELILAAVGGFHAVRGKNFFKSIDTDPLKGYPNFSIEIFPKQDSIGDKDLGNLMRLPLGRNLKTTDPTFFVDQTAPMAQLVPHKNPIELLQTGNPWK